jgi:very-short-patch-repair endonuclease
MSVTPIRFTLLMDANEPLDLALARVAERNHGIFSLEDLNHLGATEAERKARLRTGRWNVVHEGVYRMAGAPSTWRGELLAACRAGGVRAVASHRSAAALHGLPGGELGVIEITCPRWRRARRPGMAVHETGTLTPIDSVVVDSVPVTTVDRTIFDLCAVRGPVTVDLTIDNALRRDLTTLVRLQGTLTRVGRRGRKGTSLLRRLLAERDPRGAIADSEQQRRLVHVLRQHGFPDPRSQHEIFDTHDQFVARIDLAYPSLLIAIEYDSYQEHVGKQQLVRDSRRRNAIVALGWTVLVATADDVRSGGRRALASALRRAIDTAAKTRDPHDLWLAS